MTTATQDYVTDSFKTVSDSFAKTFETGTRMFEDTARFWTDAAAKNTHQARERFEKLRDDTTPFQKENVDRFHKLFDEQSQRTLDLMRKACDNLPTQDPAEASQRIADVWRNSFDTFRASVDAMSKANSDMLRGWTSLLSNCSTGNGPATAKKAAK